MSFDAMEAYYQSQGREWERYALIKARSVAETEPGDSGNALIERLKPFVYRRYLDFGVFESLREMKQKISREVRRKGMADDIKLGPGGIREIEFFGQVFQLIRGGVMPVLQARGIRTVLDALAEEKLIPDTVREDLLRAYRFLRRVENRLQIAGDQQTHTLPRDARAKLLLAGAMGFDSPEAFKARLDVHTRKVHTNFMGLLTVRSGKAAAPHAASSAGRGTEAAGLEAVWQEFADGRRQEHVLKNAGFEDPQGALKLINAHLSSPSTRALSAEGRRRLDRLIPDIIRHAAAVDQPQRALQRILEVIQTIQRRTTYLSLLLENPAALVHLVRLTAASPWITHFLSNHPVLLDELLDPRNLYIPSEPAEMQKDLQRRLAQAPADDLECQIEEMCIFKQVNTLRVAAADVTGVLALMRVSDYLSDIAATIIDAVVDMAWNHLVARHGTPICSLDGEPLAKGFSVIGYGKLGGLELGYGSDLDLVFLHAGTDETTVGGRHPIDSPQFFSRLGQRVIHLLTAHTHAGRLYEVDMRLRPDGGGGLIVSHVESFADYQRVRARTWEHQALVRARPISGDARIAGRFNRIRGEILSRKRKKALLKKEVGEMRARLRREHPVDNPAVFNIKQDPGGIVDIEFLVQYLVLLCSHRHRDLLVWTDNVRLLQTLVQTGVMDNPTADFLKHAYLILRAYAHKLSLQEKPADIPAEKFAPLRDKVRKIWEVFFGSGY
jgi:glutamate-ammonia-ligase adenylyltransferase